MFTNASHFANLCESMKCHNHVYKNLREERASTSAKYQCYGKNSESICNEKSLFLITLVRCKKGRFCLFHAQSFCMTSETWNIMHGFYSNLLGYFYGAFFVILVVHFHSHALYEKRAAWTFLEISPFVFYGRTLYGFGVNGDRLCIFGGVNYSFKAYSKMAFIFFLFLSQGPSFIGSGFCYRILDFAWLHV